MKKVLFISIVVIAVISCYGEKMSKRQLLSQDELKDIEISELPGFGLCAYLEGDSVMLLDSEDLPFVHIPAKTDARQIIVCDSMIFGAIGNAIYADTCSTPTMILDNENFVLYPATDKSFFVCTSDSTWSDVILVNPSERIYSNITAQPEPIYKIVANDEHTVALMGNQVIAIGANNEIAPLYENKYLNDIAISPHGLFMATDEGLFLAPNLNNEILISTKPFSRIWWINETLYFIDAEGSLCAIDNFSLQ